VRRKWFIVLLAIVVIPVTMTCWKVVQYAQESKAQVFTLHRHIVHALASNTTTYFQQLNMRLAFAPLLARTRSWVEQVAILNNALMSNSDFACVALLDSTGHEKAKAFDATLTGLNAKLDYSRNPFFQRVLLSRSADAGPVYERNAQSFFDILYPLENNDWMLVSVRWEALKALLFDQQVGNEGYIWLIDDTGRIVADSAHKRTNERVLPRWAFFQKRVSEPAFWEGEFDDPWSIDSVGAGQWVTGAGWYVLSAQPQSEAYAKIWQLRRKAFLWVFCSFLGLGAFGYFWVRHISMPITKLAQGVRLVTQRQFEGQITEDFGLEEFRALAQAFNRMMGELKSYDQMQVDKLVEQYTTNQSLLLSIRDGILMLGEGGSVIFSNEPARQWAIDVAGRGKEPFEKSWQSLQEYPPWTELLEGVLDATVQSKSQEFEFPVAGRSRWARVLAQRVSTDKGRYLGVMVAIRDITQDKELDKMKEDFFNGITHDLRTPLAATIGYLGLSEMQLPEGDPELGKLVGSARQSAKRALSLVETILSLARLQAGKLNLNKVPLQLQGMLAKIAADVAFQAQAKRITLTWECPDASLWVNADGSMIERVVENLTGNAIKYTMEGGWVKLTGRRVEGGIEIAIQDNGRGIPPDAIAKLFGRFQQVKAEDRQVGFGIGLAFSKGIVEAHGSAIEVTSELGKGSRFFFVLEAADPQANPAVAA
jgi:signal transduction histidine kinase/HAMP domain-containing protein